jgi:tRNA/tmRNA/rRNA uracil-C5-methylase (TrmA/RlmC/RlmD family)
VNNNKNEKWDVLLQKLHRQKGTVEPFGKIKPNQGKEVDELKCIHFDECSGCSTKGNFTDTPTMVRARNVMRAHDVPFSIQIGNVTQWRTLAKIAVQPMSKWGGLKFGLYKRGSHDVVPIPECRIHHPRINEAVEIIRFAALTTGINAYQPPHSPSAKSTGDLRYLQLVVERYSKKVQLVLVWNAANFKSISSLVSASKFLKLLRHRPDIFHSIHLNFHAGDNNVIFHQTPKAWTHIFGPPFIREKIGRATFYLRPQVFRQANIEFFERKVIPFVRKFVPEGCRAAELYAGLGVIGLNIADLTHELLLSDSNPFVGDVFDKCADSLPAEEKFRVFFDCLDADEAVEQGQCKNADLLIVDPPRKGLTPGVLQLITGKHEKVEAKSKCFA